ncbi:hypothetical protein [Capybara microvirus Cap1_SP_52]|nr:hypothetical protein [Capybara microvirus Cap1_SP_52]
MYPKRSKKSKLYVRPNISSILCVLEDSVSSNLMVDTSSNCYIRDSYLALHPDIIDAPNSVIQSYLNGIRSEIKNTASPFQLPDDLQNFDLLDLYSRGTDKQTIQDYLDKHRLVTRKFLEDIDTKILTKEIKS